MNNVYLIYGNNNELIKREVNNISKDIDDIAKYNLEEDDISLALDDLSCISMFGDKKCVVCENAYFLTTIKPSVEQDIDYLTRYLNDDNHDNILIISVVSEKLDERKKIVKLVKEKAKVIEKNNINQKNIVSFVIDEFKNNGYKIDFNTAKYFISYVGNNIDIVISEINKLIMYKDTDKNILKEDIDAISCRAFKDNVFELTNAIINKDYKKMFECYNDLIIVGEEPIKIIALLANQFTLMYQSKMLSKKGYTEKDIAGLLNVHPYPVKLALESDYLIYEVEDLLKRLHNLDYDIKRGVMDKYIGLENFLLHL